MSTALKASQGQVQLRSILVENRWSFEKCKESDISLVVSQVLSVLEIHDKFAYARHNDGISVEDLYSEIFPSITKGSSVKVSIHWLKMLIAMSLMLFFINLIIGHSK